MRRKRSLITRRDGRPGWYENFSVRGHRFRDRLSDDENQAKRDAAERYAKALLGDLPAKTRPAHQATTTLTAALARYWLEHAQHLPSADSIVRYGRVLEAGLGKEILLSELDEPLLAGYIAQRRATRAHRRQTMLSNRSINAEIEHLRAVLRRARDVWKWPTPTIEWQKIRLVETGEREHILSQDEDTRLFEELRVDFHAMVRFALITGQRLANVVGLTWRQVDWDAGIIAFRIKSKKPGGELHYLPLTPTVAAILSRERGHHPVRVFTYVCERNRRDPRTGLLQQKGARYPFTKNGWRKEWQRALAAAGIEDFRFHDLRHTAATRTLRAHKNLRAVQRMLGHLNIATTTRYTRSDVEDVRAAMEATEQAGLVNRSPNQSPRVNAEGEVPKGSKA